jgi:hypothetical protein
LIPAPIVPLHPPGWRSGSSAWPSSRASEAAAAVPPGAGEGAARLPPQRPPRARTQRLPPPAPESDVEEDEKEGDREDENEGFSRRRSPPRPRRQGGGSTEAPAYELEQEFEFCPIDCWHGYVKAHFVARVVGGQGEFIAARSPRFMWMRSGDPDPMRGARDAHTDHVEHLLAEGWQENVADAPGSGWGGSAETTPRMRNASGASAPSRSAPSSTRWRRSESRRS